MHVQKTIKMYLDPNRINLKRTILTILTYFRYFYLFSFDKIGKRVELYEFREQLIFLTKIFKISEIFENIFFFSFNDYFNFFQKMFFSVAHNIRKNLNNSNIGKDQLKSFHNFFLNKKKNIFFRTNENKVNFSEIFLKNYILVTRTKILKELMFKFHSVLSKLSHRLPLSSFALSFDFEKKLKLIGFSKKLLKKLVFIPYSNFKILLKKKIYNSRDFEQKIFYFEELMCFFKIKLTKKYTCNINKIFSFEKFFYLEKIKECKQTFESKKFLKKLFELKKINKLMFRQKRWFKPQIRNKDGLNFFSIYKNKCLFSSKIKGQKLFLELYQKNLNLYWEFERLKIKLFSSLYLKNYLKNNRLSINVYVYHLILFKILNLMNVFNSRILNFSFILEKKFYQFYRKTNLSYRDIKKTFFQSDKAYILKHSSYFEDDHIYLINLKLTQLVNTLLEKIKVKTNIKKINPMLFSAKIHLKSRKKIKNNFLKEINKWDSILHNRLTFHLFFFSDSSILNLNIRIFQFNGFDFRKTGF